MLVSKIFKQIKMKKQLKDIFITYYIIRYMKSTKQCFGCHGLFDVDDDIASSRRTSLHTLARDHEMDKSDIPTIRAFYDLNKKCYDTPLCWDCALFRVLGYTERYDEKRNG